MYLDSATAKLTLSGADVMCVNGSGWNVVTSGTELRLATFAPTGAYHWCTHCKDYVNWTLEHPYELPEEILE